MEQIALIAGALLVLLVIVIAIVMMRKKKKDTYMSFQSKMPAGLHYKYINQAHGLTDIIPGKKKTGRLNVVE